MMILWSSQCVDLAVEKNLYVRSSTDKTVKSLYFRILIAQDSCTASVVHRIHDSLKQQQKWPKSTLFVQISHHRMNVSCQYLFLHTEKNKSEQILPILTANIMKWKRNLDVEASSKSSSCACESRVTRLHHLLIQ